MDDEEFETLSIDPVNSIDDLGPIGTPDSDTDDGTDGDDAAKAGAKTGEVIALDAFRKK